MKQNSLQYLLDKYREGTLTDEERTELNRLAHRDEVMSSSSCVAGCGCSGCDRGRGDGCDAQADRGCNDCRGARGANDSAGGS